MTDRLFIAILLLLIAVQAPSSAAAEWKAGVARTNITPTEPMWMAGYAGRDRPAEGKLNDLWVKALVLEDGAGKRVALVTLDLVGIDRDLSNRVRDRMLADYKLGRESIAICSSHTHSGPMVGENLRTMNFLSPELQKLRLDYTAALEEKIHATVGDALKAMATVTLAWAVGEAGFAVNRRNNAEKNVPALRAKGELKGPVDHDLPVMTVTAADGKVAAIVYGYACHGTTTGLYKWSSDWPGVSATEIEKAHPGATAMCWIGCGGDQNPLPRKSYKLLDEYARQTAAGVEGAMASGNMKPIDAATIESTYGEIDLPFAPLPTKEQLGEDLKSTDKFVANRAKILLAKWEKDGRLSTHYPYPVQVWRLGKDLKWVFLGGEVTVEYSLRIKKEIGPRDTWVAAYANDVMAYIPSQKVLAEGRYEGLVSMVYYALPTKWAPEIEDLIVKEVHRQIEEPKK